jgi:CCR4-NOT transcription complex subunit 7/8
MIVSDSKLVLVQSGIDFQLLKQHGIDPLYLGEKLITSGLILNDSLTWICFHGCSDMGYLYKILTNDKMPHRDSFR